MKFNANLALRPLSVFLVIFVTRSCHSSNNAEAGKSLRDSAIMSTNLNILDYDLCLANYDVSEGSIIRTKDSQALGGHFINESDLGAKSREECLRLCCRTPHCNVISFEEKNSGSCYLFDCGPLENFRCKFTEQTHYMSAILRKREDPSNNQHEAELNQLRNLDDNRVGIGGGGGGTGSQSMNTNSSNMSQMSPSMIPPAAAPAPAAAAPLSLLSLDAVDKNSNSRHCSRRQFECKSTRECIAIYNACDGIPQCSDGSDESAELHCPTVDLSVKFKEGIQMQGGSSSHSEKQSTSGVDTSLVPSKSLSSSRAEDFRLAPSSISDSRQQGSTTGGKSANGLGNVNFETSHMKIFNHKDGGIMDDTYGNQLQQQRQNPVIPYFKSYDYGVGETPNGYGQPISQIQNPTIYGGTSNNNYGSNGPPYSVLPYPGNYQNSYPQQLSPYSNIERNNMNILPLSQQQQPPYYYNGNNNNPLGTGNINQIPLVIPDNSRLSPPRVSVPTGLPSFQPKVTGGGASALGVVNTIPAGETTKTTSKPTNIGKDGRVSSTISKLETMSLSAPDVKGTRDETEREKELIQRLLTKTALTLPKQSVPNVSEAPEVIPGAGAVLAFIVGVAMSVVMVIMIGCRLRRMKMGSKRRGKNRLDPDYLVDGMYL